LLSFFFREGRIVEARKGNSHPQRGLFHRERREKETSVNEDQRRRAHRDSTRQLTHILRKHSSISTMKRLSKEVLLQRSHPIRSVGESDVPVERKRESASSLETSEIREREQVEWNGLVKLTGRLRKHQARRRCIRTRTRWACRECWTSAKSD